MTRKCKTPKSLAHVIMSRHSERLDWFDEQLACHPQLKAQIVARMEGYNSALEDMMFEHNCYAGFQHMGLRKPDGSRSSVVEGHPEYLDCRRVYYTNGIAV